MRKKKAKNKKRKRQRRKAQRLYGNIYVNYRKMEDKKDWNLAAYKDISGIGIGLLVKKQLKIGSKVEVLINIEGRPKPCGAVAKVVWCHRARPHVFDAGLEFIKGKVDASLFGVVCEKIVGLSLDRRE